ncbi:MAG: isoleucine--tRNA ligase [Gammaproteobacteria bacterium]|nr:isoleucine--tRNA ligase [Gammaproteobacteria bacterium]
MCADKTDYRDTLNLPRTDFPMRAGLPKREPDWLARWDKIGVYDRLRAQKGRKPFILHDGPPYANGNLHIGHALNKILKDMVVRSQQMMGRDARYVPGWDCHGLPIEWKIEEQYRARGLNKDDVAVNELRGECRRFAEKWVDIQRDEFKRLGVTGNWDAPYLTMDFESEAVIAEEFMKFVMNGSLYRGSKPVMWSPVEKTALAEAEIEYHDHQSHTVWVKFPVVAVEYDTMFEAAKKIAPKAGWGEKSDLIGTSVVIWTTTPWTIPQNRAICFGDFHMTGIDYSLYEVTAAADDNWAKIGDQLIIADSLVASVMAAARVEQWKQVRSVGTDALANMKCAHPLRGAEGANGEWDYDVPMLPAEHVTDEAGTGFVHTAPSHGADDYNMGVKHGLPMTYNVLEDSSFRPDLPFFGGAVIFDHKGKEKDANTRVIDKLAEVGALIARGRLKHSYPHSWRSKTPVIFLNTPQWFVAIDQDLNDGMDTHGTTIRQRALTEIDNVKWTPQTGRNRLHSMIEARPDWVMSRQRAWGVPLTCFVKKSERRRTTDRPDVLQNPEVNRRIVAAFRESGADAWYEDGAKERFLDGIEGLDPSEWQLVTDILDVWFDSGSTHAFVIRDRADGAPDGVADLYLEGTDQHRGWFHSSLLQSVGTKGRAPYRGVLTHGFTLDEKGVKMSKSLGNTVLPATVIKQYGADILRLWVAQTDYTNDQRIGPEILKGVADSYRRLRNTMRFLLGSLPDISAKNRVPPADMPELERWVLHRLAELDHKVRAGYDAYDFQVVFQAIFTFATVDLSAFYFDIRKDVLYCDGDSAERRAARCVLDILYHRLTCWLAPILVFTMEEVWLQRFPGAQSSVHLLDFPDTPADWLDEPLAEKWSRIRSVRRMVTGALEYQRQQKIIGSSLEAAPVVYLGTEAHLWDSNEKAIEDLNSVNFAEVCITSSIEVRTGLPNGIDISEHGTGLYVNKHLAEGSKCQRCWKILPDVGTHSHAGVCGRCEKVLASLHAELSSP